MSDKIVRRGFILALIATAVATTSAVLAMNETIGLRAGNAALATDLATAQEAIEGWKKTGWGATAMQQYICADVKGHGQDLLAVKVDNSKNGTEYVSNISCILRDGNVQNYSVSWDPLNDGDEGMFDDDAGATMECNLAGEQSTGNGTTLQEYDCSITPVAQGPLAP